VKNAKAMSVILCTVLFGYPASADAADNDCQVGLGVQETRPECTRPGVQMDFGAKNEELQKVQREAAALIEAREQKIEAAIRAAEGKLSIKGITAGMTYSDFVMLFEEFFICLPQGAPTRCTALEGAWDSYPQKLFEYGPVKAKSITVSVGGNTVRWVILIHDSPNKFDEIVNALGSKFGPASSSSTGVLSNKFGASFKQETRTWMRDKAILKVEKYGSRLDQGIVVLSSLDALEQLEAEEKTKARADAKSM